MAAAELQHPMDDGFPMTAGTLESLRVLEPAIVGEGRIIALLPPL